MNKYICFGVYVGLVFPFPIIAMPGFKAGLAFYQLMFFILLFAVIAGIIINGRLKVRAAVVMLCVVPVSLSLAVDVVNGGYLREWYVPFLSFMIFLVAYMYAYQSDINVGSFIRLAPHALLISSALGCLHYIGVVDLFIHPYLSDAEDTERLTGFLGLTRGSIGVVYSVLAVLVVSFRLSTDYHRSGLLTRLATLISLVLALICIILSGSRTGLIAFVLGVMFPFLVATVRLRKVKVKSVIIAPIVLVVALGSVAYVVMNMDVTRFTAAASTESLFSRFEAQSKAVKYMVEHPSEFIFGRGYSTHDYMALTNSYLTHPHNEIIHTLWALGVIGILLFIVFWWVHIKASINTPAAPIIIGLFAVTTVTSMSVGGMFTPSLRLAYVGFFTFFLLGLVFNNASYRR